MKIKRTRYHGNLWLIAPDAARKLAYEWHSGQASALYALASSGLLIDPVRAGQEVQECIAHPTNSPRQVKELRWLDDFIAERVVRTTPGARWPHYAAPWAGKEWV